MSVQMTYKRFLDEYSRRYDKYDIHTLGDYLNFLDKEDIFVSSGDGWDPILFSFETKSNSTALEDVISLIKKSARAGSICLESTNWALTLPDDSWARDNEKYVKERDFHWVDEKDRSLGVYKIFTDADLDDRLSFYYHPDSDSNIDFGPSPEDSLTSDEFVNYFYQEFRRTFMRDLGRVLQNLTILSFSYAALSIEDGAGTVYILLFGFESVSKKGAGIFLEDTVR